MDKFSLLDLIGKISVFICLLLAFFLLTVNTKNKLGNRLFAGFLVITAIDLSGFFSYTYLSNYPSLEVFRISVSLLNMPLFFFYILSVCYTDFKLKTKHLLHILPFVLFNLVLGIKFYFLDFADKNLYLKNYNQQPEMIVFHLVNEVQYVIYIVLIFITLKKYKEIYLENYTNPNSLTYNWLVQIATVSVVAHSVVILKDLSKFYSDIFIWANVIVGIIALSVTCWFVLKALYHPELFRGVDSNLQLVKEIVQTNEVKQLETFEDANIRIQIDLLRKYMIEQDPYLEPSLTIQELANQIEMPVRDLSLLINHHLNQHFFDFVNEYRIQRAMKILKDPTKKELTILEILYEVGFNSKSSFNTAFKKYTNLTPTEYRNNALSTT